MYGMMAKPVARAELLRQCEDEAMKIVDQIPAHIQAIIYRYLHAQGMRIEQTEQLIRHGIDRLVAKPPL